MVDVLIIQGDALVSDFIEQGTVVDVVQTLDKSQFLIKTLETGDVVKVIDGSVISDPEFIKFAIMNTRRPLLCIFPDGKLPFKKPEIKKTENSVSYIETGCMRSGPDVFAMLKQIINGHDRMAVYDMLLNQPGMHRLIMMYLVSNFSKFSKDNQEVIMVADEMGLQKDARALASILAFSFRPMATQQYLYWNYPKKGTTNAS